MALFSYEARNASGSTITGEIEATSVNDAADLLFKSDLIPINIKAASSGFNFSWKKLSSINITEQKVKPTELSLFCRQMYSLTKAGVNVSSAIIRLGEISSNPTLKKALANIASEISSGSSLSVAMKNHVKIFSPLVVALVSSSEATGRLDAAFLQASEYCELADTTRKRIKAALRYPVMVIIFAVVAMMIVCTMVVPKFVVIYQGLHTKLPMPTLILIALSGFLNNYWWVLLLSVVALWGLSKYLFRRPTWRFALDKILLKMPIFGTLTERGIMASFSRNLAMLLKTGVSINQSLALVADIIENTYAKQKIQSIQEIIEHGKTLSEAANTVEFFSPLVLQMLAVGEETGNVDTMLMEVAGFYEREVDYEVKKLTSKIEPILLVFIGGMVLMLALGIFMPMWNLTSAIH